LLVMVGNDSSPSPRIVVQGFFERFFLHTCWSAWETRAA
jgi:hypothetical protein